MYGKGLALTLACTSAVFLRPVEAVPCTSPVFLRQDTPPPCTSLLFLQPAVHFARFLAGASFRARKAGKCTSKGPPNAHFGVHFCHILAGSRALRPFPCTKSRRCKDSGEVHAIVQESRGRARLFGRRLPAFSRISPNLCKPTQSRSPYRAGWADMPKPETSFARIRCLTCVNDVVYLVEAVGV